jgi:hypothetical protein
LTGPHTFTASFRHSPHYPSARLRSPQSPQGHDAVKASVPKLFDCPGAASFTPGFRGSRWRVASQRLRKPTTPSVETGLGCKRANSSAVPADPVGSSPLSDLSNLQHRRLPVSWRIGFAGLLCRRDRPFGGAVQNGSTAAGATAPHAVIQAGSKAGTGLPHARAVTGLN